MTASAYHIVLGHTDKNMKTPIGLGATGTGKSVSQNIPTALKGISDVIALARRKMRQDVYHINPFRTGRSPGINH